MRISSLSLVNFRNFAHIDAIEFPEAKLLVAAAPNATGKTNFLESIVFLLRGKSFRAGSEDCVKFSEQGFSLKGEIVSDSGDNSTVDVGYDLSGRKLRISENGAPVSPVLFYSHYPLVVFLPDDTFLFQRGPAYRRNFLNTTLVSVPKYLSALVQYHRVLRQRNTALKKAQNSADVSVWNDLLVQHATEVWGQRAMFVDFLSTHLSELYATLSGSTFSFNVSFEKGVDTTKEYIEVLSDSWEQEKRYQHTLSGPHRDDLKITIDNKLVLPCL